MRVLLLIVGRARAPLDVAVVDFEKRASRYWKLSIKELSAGAKGRGSAGDPDAVRLAESDRILAAIPTGARVMALTREGRPMDSPEFADFLADCAVKSVRDVVFVVGGAFGLHADVLSRANRRLSLSNMTLPHEMARLFLGEQLYRAGTILKGEPYHKGGGGR